MGGDIIAEKFALLRTRGSSGVAFTHVVEDTLSGERAVVKVSDKLGPLTLEYLKTMNLVREIGLPGINMPYEGGILEEEAGYYMAFPEVGEPSLENYLRIGVPLTCEEALSIIDEVLGVLDNLHNAGFYHLFINTRNVFYRRGDRVLLKDPALQVEFFHPFLEVIDSPDFSYFSPEVMDGADLGAEADLYAVGRLAEVLLEQAAGAKTSPAAQAVGWMVDGYRRGAATGDHLSAGDIRNILEKVKSGDRQEVAPAARVGGEAGSEGEDASVPNRRRAEDSPGCRGKGRRLPPRVVIALASTLLLFIGLVVALGVWARAERAPAGDRAGGSMAGRDAAADSRSEVTGGPENEGPEASPEGSGDVVDAPKEETAPSGEVMGVGNNQAADTIIQDPPQDEAPVEESPASPVASFNVSPGEGQSPLQVYLDASSSHDPDGSIASYSWSFGGSGQALYHVFESNVIPANIPVILTVTDDGGHSSSTTRYVTVY